MAHNFQISCSQISILTFVTRAQVHYTTKPNFGILAWWVRMSLGRQEGSSEASTIPSYSKTSPTLKLVLADSVEQTANERSDPVKNCKFSFSILQNSKVTAIIRKICLPVT